MDTSFYIGQWIDFNLEDGKDIILITSVSNDGIASTEDGRKISIKDLDLSGRYKKIMAPTDIPEIKNELGTMGFKPSEQAVKSATLGDLSKIGHSKQTNTPFMNESNPGAFKAESDSSNFKNESSSINNYEAIQNDPVGLFIESAINISKQSQKSGCKIPVTITLNFDFDIIKVIEMCMQIGASDIEILQKILKQININESEVKKLIAKELLQSPDDVEIVNENREDEFGKTLSEELETINGIEKYDPEK